MFFGFISYRFLQNTASELPSGNIINSNFIKHNNTIFYKTGDLGFINYDGNISFIGRTDSQIKFKGYRIELGEINNTIKKLPFIQNSYTLIKSLNSNDVLCSYVITDSTSISPESIKINSSLLRATITPKQCLYCTFQLFNFQKIVT